MTNRILSGEGKRSPGRLQQRAALGSPRANGARQRHAPRHVLLTGLGMKSTAMMTRIKRVPGGAGQGEANATR